MDPEDHRDPLESSRFIEDATEYLRSSVSREELQRLLTEDGAWDTFVAEAELSRDEDSELHKALRNLVKLMAVEDRDRLQRELEDRKKFLEAFPQLKSDLEEHIEKLRSLAEHMEEVHRGCTISNVVTDSVSVASGVLGILGIVFAPVTAGGSLLLLATGAGLGAAATVSGVTTLVVEETSRLSDEAKVRQLISTGKDLMEEVSKTLEKISTKVLKETRNFIKDVKDLGSLIRAFRAFRANPRSAADARILRTGGRIPAQGARQVHSATGSSAMAITRRARLRGAAWAGAFLALDVYSLVTDSQHLQEGAKSESAEALRKLIRDMQEKLQELEQIHRTLQSDPPQ